MRTLTPRLDILPGPQRRLWDEFADVPEAFTLYGGTAVALHLGHRQSVDFDLFGSVRFDPASLLDRIPFLRGAQTTQSGPDTLSVTVDRRGPVRVSFFGVPRIGMVEPPFICRPNGLRVASLADLAGMKASVVQRRAEAKDYLDLDALIASGVRLPLALSAAGAIYGAAFNPQITLKALAWFDEGDVNALPEGVKQRLRAAVRSVDLGSLPPVTPFRFRSGEEAGS